MSTILIVDDDGMHSRRLVHDLESIGHSVVVEKAPAAALHLLRTARPERAAIEPILPGSSWVRFLQAVSAAKATSWLVVTAFPSSSLAVEAMKLGAQDVLPKPVAGSELESIWSGGTRRGTPRPYDLSLARHEWEHLNRVLRLTEGNLAKAAHLLGISRQSLYNKLRKLPPESPAGETEYP